MITTSRYCSQPVKDLARNYSVLLNINYLSRGKKTIEQLARQARRAGAERLIIVKEEHGKPRALDIISVNELSEWKWLDSIGIAYENEI